MSGEALPGRPSLASTFPTFAYHNREHDSVQQPPASAKNGQACSISAFHIVISLVPWL
jgi:hypothetical protein